MQDWKFFKVQSLNMDNENWNYSLVIENYKSKMLYYTHEWYYVAIYCIQQFLCISTNIEEVLHVDDVEKGHSI